MLCHSVESIYELNLQEWNYYSNISNIIKVILFTIGRLGVPIFLLLTGFLTLNKNFKNDEDVHRFYKKNLLPIIVTTEIWIVIYTIFLIIYEKQKFSIEILLRRMLFFEYTPSHMWYMPMIIGIYLAIPFVGNVLKSFSIQAIKIPLCIIIISSFILPTINNVLQIFSIKTFNIKLDLEFLGASYGIYIILGYIISKGLLKKIKNIYLIFSTGISFIMAVGIQIFIYNRGTSYNIWYNSIFILLTATCLFELFTRIKNDKNKIQKVFTFLSESSFAIFFIHKIVLICLKDNVNNININNPLKVVLMFLVTTLLCIIIILSLRKVKWIKNKVFLIKE